MTLTPSQAVRDAAADHYTVCRLDNLPRKIRLGEADNDPVVQKLAQIEQHGIVTGLRMAVEIAERWRDENKASAVKARKSLSEGANNMAEMLDGAAIECNAIAGEIEARAKTIEEDGNNG